MSSSTVCATSREIVRHSASLGTAEGSTACGGSTFIWVKCKHVGMYMSTKESSSK